MKGALYARAGVTEYWVIDLKARCVHVNRDVNRRHGRYASHAKVTKDGVLSPSFEPRVTLRVNGLFR